MASRYSRISRFYSSATTSSSLSTFRRTPNCALWTARAITLRTLSFPETEKLTTLWAYDNRFDELDVSGVPELDDLLVDPGVELEGWHGDTDGCYVYDDGDHYGIYDYDDDDGHLYGDDDYQETSGRPDAPILA